MVNSTEINKIIAKQLSKRRLFYVCRDLERTMGAGMAWDNYYIITNASGFATKLAKQQNNIILIKNKQALNTAELLNHAETKKIIQPRDFVLVFKNNTAIEDTCKQHKWKLLNPEAKLADTIESKISQVTWLGKLAKYLPLQKVDICQNITWSGKKFILQFNHSHTGNGTFLINSKNKLNELKNKFPKRPVRIMNYISGPVLTNNNIVWEDKALFGNISYQITGLSPFTNNAFTAIGNDWALPQTLLDKNQIKQYKKIVTDVGKKLYKDGWKGLFGIDIIMDKKNGKLYLLEINARQPASTTFESQLQQSVILSGAKDDSALISTFTAHVAALLKLKQKNYELIKINNGAQIIQRVTDKISRINKLEINNSAIINIIYYNNNSLGSDLARIQSNQGIMKTHNQLNTLGKIIASSIC
jgi:hypothetical protein